MPLEEMPSPVKYKPWIPTTEEDFRLQFGDGIVLRLTNAIGSRIQTRKNPLEVSLNFAGKKPSSSESQSKDFDTEAETEFSNRFKAKVLYLGEIVRHSVMMGFQGDVDKFKKVDNESPFLKKILLDLIAYEFLKELGVSTEEETTLFERGRQVLVQLSDWEKGNEPVRLLDKHGDWVDSHSHAIAYG